MSKSLKLKSILKAADRRRRRRFSDAAPPNAAPLISNIPPDSTVHCDVTAIMIDAALAVAQQNSGLKDSAIIGALRAMKSDSRSNAMFTQIVYDEMVARLDQAGINGSVRRKSAGDLLEIALQNVSPDAQRQLINYLELLAT